MPLSRKRSRVSRRTRRVVRRRVARVRRPIRSNRPVVMSFRRMFWVENWAFSAATTAGFWRQYTPSFSQLPNAAEYQALFDTYRINGVKITFRPRFDGADANGSNSGGATFDLPYLNTYVDPISNFNATGAYGSATFNTFLENANGRIKSKVATKPISVYWKPLVSVNSYTAGNPGEYKRCPFLSTANYPAVPQRLLNVFISQNNFSASMTWSFDVFFTFYFQCRGAR